MNQPRHLPARPGRARPRRQKGARTKTATCNPAEVIGFVTRPRPAHAGHCCGRRSEGLRSPVALLATCVTKIGLRKRFEEKLGRSEGSLAGEAALQKLESWRAPSGAGWRGAESPSRVPGCGFRPSASAAGRVPSVAPELPWLPVRTRTRATFTFTKDQCAWRGAGRAAGEAPGVWAPWRKTHRNVTVQESALLFGYCSYCLYTLRVCVMHTGDL